MIWAKVRNSIYVNVWLQIMFCLFNIRRKESSDLVHFGKGKDYIIFWQAGTERVLSNCFVGSKRCNVVNPCCSNACLDFG